MNAADTAVLGCPSLANAGNGDERTTKTGRQRKDPREALKKLESWKTWSRRAAVTAEGQLQCSFLTIFSACSAPPRDIDVPKMPSRSKAILSLATLAQDDDNLSA